MAAQLEGTGGPTGSNAWRCTQQPSALAWGDGWTLRAAVFPRASGAKAQRHVSATDQGWQALVGSKGVWTSPDKAQSQCLRYWRYLCRCDVDTGEPLPTAAKKRPRPAASPAVRRQTERPWESYRLARQDHSATSPPTGAAAECGGAMGECGDAALPPIGAAAECDGAVGECGGAVVPPYEPQPTPPLQLLVSMGFAEEQAAAELAAAHGDLQATLAVLVGEPTTEHTAPLGPLKRKRKSVNGKEYHQAKESQSDVEVLCFTCRRNPAGTSQASLKLFFDASHERKTPSAEGTPLCSRCRKPMVHKKNSSGGSAPSRVLPHIARLNIYKRLASQHQIPFELTDAKAAALMRADCVFCGKHGGAKGNGITRLRQWPERMTEARDKALKGFMGPFCEENVTTACGVCNLMKGPRAIASYVEAARTIGTHRYCPVAACRSSANSCMLTSMQPAEYC